MEWFTQARSQTKEPPLPGVITCIFVYLYVSLKYSYVFRMYPYVSVCYSYVTRMLPVCTRVWCFSHDPVQIAKFHENTSVVLAKQYTALSAAM